MANSIKWHMVSDIALIRARRDQAQRECEKITKADSYTDAYKFKATGQKIQELKDTAESVKAEMDAEVNEAVKALDEVDTRNIESRNLDVDYLQRLGIKLDTIVKTVGISPTGVANPDVLDHDWLKAFFAEYTDDPVAIQLIKARLGSFAYNPNDPEKSILPSDKTGKAQIHLKALNTVFGSVVDVLAKSLGEHGLAKGDSYNKFFEDQADAFIKYVSAQDENDYLPYDDIAVYEKLIANNPDLRVDILGIQGLMKDAIAKISREA